MIVTQKHKDVAQAATQLATWNNVLALRVNRVVSQVAYSVRRTAALPVGPSPTSGRNGNITQFQFEHAVQLEASPFLSNATVYILILEVDRSERAAYEAFYGWKIVRLNQFLNKTSPSEEKEGYVVFTRFTGDPGGLLGLDIFAPEVYSQIGVLIQNQTLSYLAQGHASLAGKGPRRWGLFIGGYNPYARAYALARIEMEAILEEAIAAPRDQVIVGAWGVFPRESFQLMFLDNSTLLDNLTTIQRFNASKNKALFQTLTVDVLGGQILFALKYSDELQAQYWGTAWISLAVVLSCVCAGNRYKKDCFCTILSGFNK